MSEPWLRRYNIYSVDLEGWAIVVIGSDGFFSAVSDWGNYAYYWPCHGFPDFRDFLINVDRDYLARKLNPVMQYDRAATLQAVKEDILEGRRNRSYSQGEAGLEWDLVKDHDDLATHHDFLNWLTATNITDAAGLRRNQMNPDVLRFSADTMTRLVAMLRTELESETK